MPDYLTTEGNSFGTRRQWGFGGIGQSIRGELIPRRVRVGILSRSVTDHCSQPGKCLAERLKETGHTRSGFCGLKRLTAAQVMSLIVPIGIRIRRSTQFHVIEYKANHVGGAQALNRAQ
jgi:hypothetical protein